MFKSLVVLAVSSMMAAPAVAQSQPAGPSAPVAAKPQTVKKRVCYAAEADSYSRLGERKICKTVEVPVQAAASNNGGQAQTNTAPTGEAGNKR